MIGYDGLWFMNKETLTDILRTLIYDVFLETFIGKKAFLKKKNLTAFYIYENDVNFFLKIVY